MTERRGSGFFTHPLVRFVLNETLVKPAVERGIPVKDIPIFAATEAGKKIAAEFLPTPFKVAVSVIELVQIATAGNRVQEKDPKNLPKQIE